MFSPSTTPLCADAILPKSTRAVILARACTHDGVPLAEIVRALAPEIEAAMSDPSVPWRAYDLLEAILAAVEHELPPTMQ